MRILYICVTLCTSFLLCQRPLYDYNYWVGLCCSMIRFYHLIWAAIPVFRWILVIWSSIMLFVQVSIYYFQGHIGAGSSWYSWTIVLLWTETIDALQKAILKSRLLGKSRTVFLLFLLIFGIFSLTLQRGKGYGSFRAGVCACGGIGRRVGLRIQWFRSCRFESCQAHMRYL